MYVPVQYLHFLMHGLDKPVAPANQHETPIKKERKNKSKIETRKQQQKLCTTKYKSSLGITGSKMQLRERGLEKSLDCCGARLLTGDALPKKME